MNSEQNTKIEDSKHEHANPALGPQADETAGDDGEFQISIRKLEMPVRPRGVLAE